MKTLEQLDAEHEKRRAEFLARDAILKRLPRLDHEVKFVGFPGGNSRIWVQYTVDTLVEAYGILRAYWGEFEPVSAVESGCLSVAVVGEHGPHYEGKEARWTVPECITVRQSGGKGYYAASVSFNPKLQMSIPILVKIEVKNFPQAFKARKDCTYNKFGDPGTCRLVEPSNWPPRPISWATARVNFGGGSRDAFDLNYYFSGPEHFEAAIKEVLNGQG